MRQRPRPALVAPTSRLPCRLFHPTELAERREAVGLGPALDDPAAPEAEDVHAVPLDRLAARFDAEELDAGVVPLAAPADEDAVVIGNHVVDRIMEVGEGGRELPEALCDRLGAERVGKDSGMVDRIRPQ